jgi:hypothetical protein
MTYAELTSSATVSGNDFVEALDSAWLRGRALELTRKVDPTWKQR